MNYIHQAPPTFHIAFDHAKVVRRPHAHIDRAMAGTYRIYDIIDMYFMNDIYLYMYMHVLNITWGRNSG